MKPAFALDFRDGAVALLHRTSRGWAVIGQTPFDTPDLDEAMAYLRATALGISPQGLATKLVIPNDQILYTRVAAPAADTARRRKQIAAALEGRTPYDIADLAFDHEGKGDDVAVAVVARETLAEAEAFALKHRFNPVSFAAVAPDGAFAGEPWFGPSISAANLLAPGEKVERDGEAMTILPREGAARAADRAADRAAEPEAGPVAEAPAAAPSEVTAPEAPADVADTTPDAVLAVAAPDPQPEPEPAPVPAPEPAPRPMPEPAPEPEPEPLPAPILPEEEPVEEPAEPGPEIAPPPAEPEIPAAPDLPEPEDVPAEIPDLIPGEMPEIDPGPGPEEVPFDPMLAASLSARPPEVAPADEAPMALDVPEDPAAMGRGRGGADDIPPAPPLSILRMLAGRRKPGPGAEPKAAPVVTFTSIAPATAQAEPATRTRDGAVDAQGDDLAATGAAGFARPAPLAASAKAAARPTAAAPKGIKGLGAMVTAPGLAGKDKARATPAPGRSAPPTASNPARPSSRPIGLGARPMPRRGKPRYLGLILTGILLVLLMLVGAWSTFFLASNDSATEEPATAVAASESAPTDTPPTAEDEAAADLAAEEGDLPAPSDVAALDPGTKAPLPDAGPGPEGPGDAGAAAVAARGTLSGGTDEILLAAADPAPAPPDPSVLALADARSDALPAPALPPPAFGTTYQFDADGLIVPTPEGIATPEGVLLVAGRPAVIPASRPASVLAAAAAAAPTGTAPEAGTLTAPGSTVPLVDDAATETTTAPAPRARPATLVPAPADSGALALPPGPQIAATARPRLRPATPAPQSASLVSGGEVLAGDGSAAPAARPEDVEQAVAAALAAAEEAPPDSASADSATPEADAEPEEGGGQIPSSASVAREATVKNAVNLSKLTLIGIFGTESNRHALVRQPNGRLVKVEVGDRLDGGKVVAITATEVRIQKGGQVLSLTLPKT